MRKLAVVFVVTVLGGCAADTDRPIPDGAEVMDVSQEVAEWNAQPTLPPVPAGCPTPVWATVDVRTFEDVCSLPSCGDATRQGSFCAFACSYYSGDQPVEVWAGPDAAGDHTVSDLQHHETLHMLEQCVFGDGDASHTNRAVWRNAVTPVF